jgi:hypothetical protein
MLRFSKALSHTFNTSIKTIAPFSDFFRDRDRSEFRATELRSDHDFRYLRIKDKMDNNKMKKEKIRERRERLKLERGEKEEEG